MFFWNCIYQHDGSFQPVADLDLNLYLFNLHYYIVGYGHLNCDDISDAFSPTHLVWNKEQSTFQACVMCV